jgi:glutamyl-tRNA synthetase
VVVDDIDMKITHVIRGEDHIANTAKQILLYEALGQTVPAFAHTPLILNQDGRKLSKRDGVTSISDFQQMGYTAPALANYMSLLGWTPPDATQEIFTLEEAAKQFSFDRVNKAGAKFDWDKLDWLNSQYIHHTPAPELTELLIPYWQQAGYAFDPVQDRPWLEQLTALLGPSLTRLKDVIDMSDLFFVETVQPDEEAQAQLAAEGAMTVVESIAAQLNSEASLTTDSAKALIKAVTKETKLKKGLIMRSLRAALTGAVHGPDLIETWVLLHQRGLDQIRFQSVLNNR